MSKNTAKTSAPTTPAPANSQPSEQLPLAYDEPIIRFMKYRRFITMITILVTLAGLVSLVTRGLNLGLDFTGGVSAELHYANPVTTASVQSALNAAGFKEPVVQYLGTQRELLVRMPVQEGADLAARLNKAVQLPNNTATVHKVDAVGSQVGNELYLRSLGAIALALVMMLIYVAVRFELKLAVGAVMSLLHDTLFTVGLFSIFWWPFDLTALAAVLALIGYSLNDTIVVFDRIRENFRKIRGATPVEVVDISLTETLRRTIMTVTTVLLVVLSMMFLGGDGLYWFSVTMLVGLFAGTYSSIYIAANYALMMGLNRQDFLVTVKPEFEESLT